MEQKIAQLFSNVQRGRMNMKLINENQAHC